MSCDCNVTCLFIVTKKEKEKEIQKKRNIKSRKIDRRKRKMLVSKVFHNNILFKIADSFQLEISKPTKSFSTRYSDNNQDFNSILDLIFLQSFSSELNNHHIHPDWRLTSDHTPISVDIPIFDEHISSKRRFLIKNSNEENHFLKELVYLSYTSPPVRKTTSPR